MKIFNLLLVIIFCFLASCSEVTNPSYIEDIQDYMPLSIGNYWVYDVYDSLKSESHIDSMVVVSDTTILNKKMFVVHNFRDGAIRDTGYYCISGNSIALYGKVLMPLLWTPDSQCFSKQTVKIYSILDNKEKWMCRDSVYGIISTLKVNFAINLIIIAIRYDSKNAQFNDSTYKSIDVKFHGIRTYYEYYTNYKFSEISNDLNLFMRFAKGIGIINSYENTMYDWEYCQTRKLLRYKVN
jgi:hypothetical protein